MPNFADEQFIYEINTWVWLTELSHRYRSAITLLNVPDEVLDDLALPGIDYIWMMGVWQRSAFAHHLSLTYKHEYLSVLPDLTDEDVIGSAYAIGDYRVDDRIGGREGLASFRERLARRGLKLILDYVPNHVAVDHPWVAHHPEYIVQGTPLDLTERPADFFTAADARGVERVYAHGRDPYFPGWGDTAQIDAFEPKLREATRALLLDIAEQCDGIRCDMAMLMMSSIFAETWNGRAGAPPAREFWVEMISAVKAQRADFLFIAEVYWNREYDLLLQGFDFCYDKVFYDRVMVGDVQQLRQHLVAELSYQQRMLRFLENHDEPRAYETLGAQRSLPAATLLCTLPGGTLLHQGQFTGRRVKLPVQIKRAPNERQHPKLAEYYRLLLRETEDGVYQTGRFALFQVNPAGRGSTSNLNLLAYGWYSDSEKDYRLIVVNLTEQRSQGRIDLSAWKWLRGRRWRLFNALDGQEFVRQGGATTRDGLFIDLDPYESFILYFHLEDEPDEVRHPHGGHRTEVF